MHYLSYIKIGVLQEGFMFKETIQSILDGNSLSETVAEQVMDEIMEGNATDSQIAGYLIALRMKGEVVDEIVEKHGSWETRQNYKRWHLLEVA